MSQNTIWLDPQVVAAIASAFAAIAAAVATWRGPIAAAEMADELRQKSETEADRRRFKLNVFASLMQERAEIYSPDAVRALNSIDIAFSDNIEVREAWSELYQALNGEPDRLDHVIEERTRNLLRSMASDLGLAETLRLDDFARVYYPRAMADERRLQNLQRTNHLAQLTGQSSNNADENAALAGRWPPKPE